MTTHEQRRENSRVHGAISAIFAGDSKKCALADLLSFREQLASAWYLLPLFAAALHDLADDEPRTVGLDMRTLTAALDGIGGDVRECAELVATMAGYRPHGGARDAHVWLSGEGTLYRDSTVHRLPRNWCRDLIESEAMLFPDEPAE